MATANPVVLIIEDDAQMRRMLQTALRSHDYHVVEAGTAREGLAQAAGRNPDIILLDLGLPDGDGLDVARMLRKSTRRPIIVLSARGQERDKIAALDLGADDYLTKPFGINELLARIRVALRHATAPLDAGAEPVFEAGDLRVDRALPWQDIARVTLGDEVVDELAHEREVARLTKRFQLLKEDLRRRAKEAGLIDGEP